MTGSTMRHLALISALALTTCERGKCKIEANPPSGTYTVTDAYRPELVGATVTISGDTVTVRYTLPDGSRWRARYRVDDAYTY